MRNTFKVLFYVNSSKEKNGVAPILGRITVNGQAAQFSCKQTVALSLWDAKANRAKGKGAEAQKINHALDKIKAKIIEHYQQIREREGFASAEMVKNAWQGIGNEYETLLSAFDRHNADFSKRVGKDRSKGTYQKYCIVRNHLARFIKSYYKRNDMSMKELTEEFIRQFDIYLRTEVSLSPSGVWMYTVPLKMIVTRAHCDGHLHRNPFANYHASPQVKERQFLTEEELQTMINHPFSKPSFAKMRDIFVFGCLTGISFIDIKNLTTDNLVNINGNWWIVANRKKTKIPFRVMLLDSALRIIERYEPFRKGNYLFDFLGNQHANRKLKQIAKACGIEKHLVFHSSRHTFGTLALVKGMPIESVSKILGHTKITTTQIYAKITTEKLEHDISAFGKKLEAGLAVKPQSLAQPERGISPVKKERAVGRL
ncbi:site-specific integrase [Bacteroides reticulotermitis]|uniref:Integrase n=2 Tax=Bacteroides reticulotermitis TaxID=1133319 RepID=W4V080_9BACE|nr:site-specific integrase [Bacteroides reticulotermitis]MBB4046192.1 integrase [Bacteroides reticulotermitis]GAE86144.1 integrase [Bacteroides reticulotermitis JCM 10512]